MYSILDFVLFILFATYKNGIYPTIKGYGSLYLLFKPLIFSSIGAVVCLFTEYLYYVIKGDKKNFYYLFTSSYAIIPGVFLSLIIPINTPITYTCFYYWNWGIWACREDLLDLLRFF